MKNKKFETIQTLFLHSINPSARRTNLSILVLAGLIHLEILLLAYYIVKANVAPREKDKIVVTEMINEVYEPIDLNKKRSVIKKTEDDPLQDFDPKISNVEINDPRQTDNQENNLKAEGETDAISDSPLIGTGIMGNIGGGEGRSGAFGLRSGGGKKKAIMRGGGSQKTESAVNAALFWLKRQQDKSGCWDKRKYGDSSNNGGFSREMTEGHLTLTCLSTLAFLAAGNTPKSGRFRETVKKSVDWILKWQLPDGSFGETQEFSIYDNAICALVLAELVAMCPEERYKLSAQKAIDYLAEVKNVHRGISRIPNIPNSTSVNGWMLMAFKSAKIAGLMVPPEVFEKMRLRLSEVSYKSNNGVYISVGYMQKRDRNSENTTMNAVGLVMFEYLGTPQKELKILANDLATDLPVWGMLNANHEMYHWYYTTLGLYQFGGENWDKWNKSISEMLIKYQCDGGPLDGSADDLNGCWPSEYDLWGRTLGRIYTTAMATLCLEVYYRYDRMYQSKE